MTEALDDIVRVTAAPGVWRTVCDLMRPHVVYAEPFGGSAFIARHKLPVDRTVIVEADPNTALWLKNYKWSDPGVEIINGCGIEWLETLAGNLPADSLIFCDPPWPLSTRGNRTYYRHEMNDRQHHRTIMALRNLKCDVILMSAPNDFYQSLLWGWHRVDLNVGTHGGSKPVALWCNYDPPTVFCDTRYAGRDFRERERIKKKARRWLANYCQCHYSERAAILDTLLAAHAAAIAAAGDAPSTTQQGNGVPNHADGNGDNTGASSS